MSRRLRPASVAQISPEASLSTLTTSPNITYSTAEEWLKVHVNSFLQFHDPELAEEYKNFHTAHQTYIPIVCAVLFILCILVPYTIAFIISVTSTDSNPVKDHEIIGWIIIYVLLVLFLSIFSLSCLIIRGYFKNFVNLNRFFINNVYSLRSFTFIGINTIICAHLVFRVMNGECEDNEDSSWNFWTCNPHSSTRGLPIDSVVLTIIVPRLLSLVMREVNGKIQGFCWLSASTSLFFCGSYVGARHSFLFFVIYCLGLVLILYDSSCHKLTLFYHYDNLRKTLAENERKADEIHATEMRHMIGNVAHDLKTPLSSFLSGIEFIIHVTTELRAKLTSNKTCGPEDLYDTLQAISNCTKNMTSTNRFMLMAINRCIDYTKASKGLKLNPKFETIDLMETLSLPLNCMSDVQSTVTIRLLPIPKQICSHIITDKQWLQENILCLLSNAVKYSSEGEVTISLSLHTEVKGNGGLFKKMKSIMVSRRALTDLEDCDTETGKMTQPPIPQPSAAAKYMAETSVPTLSPRSKEDDSDKSSTISRTSRMIQPEVFLRIEIEDHGIGIEDDVMPNLFSPFKQAQRLAGGTGLGLYSLAKRIEALKGHYGVRHRRDLKHGTLFWFEFPYRPDSFSANLSKSPPPREVSASSVSPLPSITGIPSFTSLASNNTVALHQANNSWRSSNSEMNKGFPSSPATPTYQLHQSMMTTTTTLTTTAPNNNFTVQDFSSRDSPLPVNLEGNGSFPPPTEPQSAMNNSLSPSFTLKVPKKPLNILLVDDAASILKMSSMMLKRGGHKITTAVNGADALHKIYHTLPGQLITPLNPNEPLPNFFDVIIMDLQMPVMDGLEATRRVRRLETTGQLQSTKRDNSNLSTPITEANNLIPVAPDIPRTIIIGCSANSDDETIEEAYKAGVDAFMAKPFSIDAFYQIYDELTNSPVEEEGGDEKSDINSRSNTPTKVDGIHKVLVKVASISGRAMSHNNLNQASRHKLTPHVSRQISQSRYLSTVTDVVDYNI